MIIKAGWSMVLVGVVFFLGSFAGTVATRSQTPTTEPASQTPTLPLACWLKLEAGQAAEVQQVDPSFTEERWTLQRDLDQARTDLALLFEDQDASDETLQKQVEVVIAAHNALERRVAAYLIAVRPHLAPGQQKKLFRLCADRVRQGRARCWRQDTVGCCTCGKGCGPGPASECVKAGRRGLGKGAGQGRRGGGGRGLGRGGPAGRRAP